MKLILACGLYYRKYGVLKPIRNSLPRRSGPRRQNPRNQPASTTTPLAAVEEEAMCPSSPPQRTAEPMSEIDHPLLSEGICLPRMGYLRDNNVCESGVDDGESRGKYSEPEDEMEIFFSDIVV